MRGEAQVGRAMAQLGEKGRKRDGPGEGIVGPVFFIFFIVFHLNLLISNIINSNMNIPKESNGNALLHIFIHIYLFAI